MTLGLLRGAAAGAAGTTALNAVTYLDMADMPLKLFGISDPSEWEAKDWVADPLPHLVYGLVTYATIRAASDQ